GGRGRPRKRRWVLFTVVGLLAVALIGAIALAGYYGKSALDALDSIKREPSMTPTEGATRPAPVPTKEGETAAPLNFVLMGSDTRGDVRGLYDVLQRLHVLGARAGAYLMSIPSDTWVELPGRGQAKITAAYSFGGAGLTIETMEALLDVPMDHTVIIDFE